MSAERTRGERPSGFSLLPSFTTAVTPNRSMTSSADRPGTYGSKAASGLRGRGADGVIGVANGALRVVDQLRLDSTGFEGDPAPRGQGRGVPGRCGEIVG